MERNWRAPSSALSVFELEAQLLSLAADRVEEGIWRQLELLVVARALPAWEARSDVRGMDLKPHAQTHHQPYLTRSSPILTNERRGLTKASVE